MGRVKDWAMSCPLCEGYGIIQTPYERFCCTGWECSCSGMPYPDTIDEPCTCPTGKEVALRLKRIKEEAFATTDVAAF